ncbi:MAG: (R)-citramalate synthase [Phycisphaerae bacterium]|nr:(R)-citramalate synthase [Phycisphaerae bacterium]
MSQQSDSHSPDAGRRIATYDTTLRDGTQGSGVSLSLEDKLMIARRLDEIGIDYIEGGYPLSNPKDVAFFAETARMRFRHAKVAAFGMTRRKGVRAADDVGMNALADSNTPTVTVVGKTWDLHATEVLRVSLDENLAMIADSVRYLKSRGREVIYDAEHFFDGYRANEEYALKTLAAAVEAGADVLVLCDTNGGSLPAAVARATARVAAATRTPLGIHTHNDSSMAVANALAAIEAGAVQVQGTINGIGERCGNMDLTTVIPVLELKKGYRCLPEGHLRRLTELSTFVYEVANMIPPDNQPFVGQSAFAHKGGMHVHGVQRLSRSYEHVDPATVGNKRRVLISELSGVSTVSDKVGGYKIEDRAVLRSILEEIQNRENQGFFYEAAEASFDLIVRKAIGRYHPFFELNHYRAIVLKEDGQPPVTEATVKLRVGGGRWEHTVAEGDGPVNALDQALRKSLLQHYPALDEMHLVDYKVRVINPTEATAAKVRVMIESSDHHGHWGTIGVSENIIDASWSALVDSIEYMLLRDEDRRQAEQDALFVNRPR